MKKFLKSPKYCQYLLSNPKRNSPVNQKLIDGKKKFLIEKNFFSKSPKYYENRPSRTKTNTTVKKN